MYSQITHPIFLFIAERPSCPNLSDPAQQPHPSPTPTPTPLAEPFVHRKVDKAAILGIDKRPRSDSAPLSPSTARPVKRATVVTHKPPCSPDIQVIFDSQLDGLLKIEESDSEIEVTFTPPRVMRTALKLEPSPINLVTPSPPMRKGTRAMKVEPGSEVIDLVTPEKSKLPQGSRKTRPTLPLKSEELKFPLPQPTSRTITSAPPPIELDRLYDSWQDAQKALVARW